MCFFWQTRNVRNNLNITTGLVAFGLQELSGRCACLRVVLGERPQITTQFLSTMLAVTCPETICFAMCCMPCFCKISCIGKHGDAVSLGVGYCVYVCVPVSNDFVSVSVVGQANDISA